MKRIQRVDLGRFLAVVAIIILHVQPFRLIPPEQNTIFRALDILLTNMARFAVPFFFVISGYFWGTGIRNGQSPIPFSLRKIRRIALVFLFWTVIYLIPYSRLNWGISFWDVICVTREYINELWHQPVVDILVQGSSLHLWFLVALMCSMAISALFISKKQERFLLLVSVALYIVGVLAKSYLDTPVGLHIGFNTLYGPFFGTLFFVSGYFLSGYSPTEKWHEYGMIMFVLGSFVHFSEMIILWRVFSNPPQHDYVFGTYFMGLGFSMFILSGKPDIKENIFSKIGRLSLGIYTIHYVFVDLFSGMNQIANNLALWHIGYVLIVFLLSTFLAYILSLNRFTRMFVA